MPRGVCKTSTDGCSFPRRAMNYWLGLINPPDVMRLWRQLDGSARVATRRITWVLMENGITLTTGQRLDVTAYTTADGFVLRFTEQGTSTQNGAKSEIKTQNPLV